MCIRDRLVTDRTALVNIRPATNRRDDQLRAVAIWLGHESSGQQSSADGLGRGAGPVPDVELVEPVLASRSNPTPSSRISRCSQPSRRLTSTSTLVLLRPPWPRRLSRAGQDDRAAKESQAPGVSISPGRHRRRRLARRLAGSGTFVARDLLVAVGPYGAVAAKEATASIPTVFVLAANPVRTGLVASLYRTPDATAPAWHTTRHLS